MVFEILELKIRNANQMGLMELFESVKNETDFFDDYSIEEFEMDMDYGFVTVNRHSVVVDYE